MYGPVNKFIFIFITKWPKHFMKFFYFYFYGNYVATKGRDHLNFLLRCISLDDTREEIGQFFTGLGTTFLNFVSYICIINTIYTKAKLFVNL